MQPTGIHGSSLRRRPRGIALIVVMSVLVILALLAATFAVLMNLELQQSSVDQNALQLGLLLRAGTEHAKVMLTTPAAQTSGRAPRTQANGEAPAPDWVYVGNSAGDTVGRYRLVIEDEAAKANINTAARVDDSPGSGWDTSEINLARALALSPERVRALVAYRYGVNGVPGARGDDDHNNAVLMADGLDNNANGVIDEDDEGVDDPREYKPTQLQGDDRCFSSLSEMFPLLFGRASALAGANRIRHELMQRATMYAVDEPGSPTLPLDTPADVNCMNARQWRALITKANWRKPFEPNPLNQARLAPPWAASMASKPSASMKCWPMMRRIACIPTCWPPNRATPGSSPARCANAMAAVMTNACFTGSTPFMIVSRTICPRAAGTARATIFFPCTIWIRAWPGASIMVASAAAACTIRAAG
ncbi:MAG: hypothetical protein NTV22_08915 [bacterium]|nr:hypothetical protein [bacterium]